MRYHPLRLISESRRGSVLILVVTIVAVLGLLGTTMGFSSRVDLASSRNISNMVQARMAAVTGIPLFAGPGDPGQSHLFPQTASRITNRGGYDPLKPVAIGIHVTEPRTRFTSGRTPLPVSNPGVLRGNTFIKKHPTAQESLTQLNAEDTSAKININAIIPGSFRIHATPASKDAKIARTKSPQPSRITEAALAGLITEITRKRQIPGVNANLLARHIARHRFGPDQQPGAASIDDNYNGRRTWRDARPTTQVQLYHAIGKDKFRSPISSDLAHNTPIYSDQIDNDLDGKVDENDESILTDGLDNDDDGRIDEAGEDIDDWAECISDVRRNPHGDDRFYGTTRQLLGIPGMTPQLYNALEPYLTVFSVSCSAFIPDSPPDNKIDGLMGWPMVDPNTSPPEWIHQVLMLRFPHAPQALIGQFTVNLIDRRDKDDLPTHADLGGRNYTGIEIAPCINEVCPDVSSFDEEGDDGQFVELFNPWNRSFNLSGWSIKSMGPPTMLHGSIPAKGYLVITDDFNNDSDPTPEDGPEQGSFYAIFGRVPTSNHRRLIEFESLDLANDQGEIQLLNPQGDVIDIFTWENGRWSGAPMSFQRVDPRLRSSGRKLATPLGPNHGSNMEARAKRNIRIQEENQNKPFHSTLDVMLISSAYIGGIDGQDDTEYAWRLPVLNARDSTELDVRLIDCFRVGAKLTIRDHQRSRLNHIHKLQAHLSAPSRGHPSNANLPYHTLQSIRRLEPVIPPRVSVQYGLININMAPLEILNALPGMDPTFATQVDNVRRQTSIDPFNQDIQTPGHKKHMVSRPFNLNAISHWRNLSDLVIDDRIWNQRPLYDRLDTVYPFLRMLTTHSQSYRLVTVNRPPPKHTDTSASSIQPSQIMAERIIAADRGAVETIQFRYMKQEKNPLGDPDLLYSAPESSAGQVLYIADLLFRNPIDTEDPSFDKLSPGMQAVFHPHNRKF